MKAFNVCFDFYDQSPVHSSALCTISFELAAHWSDPSLLDSTMACWVGNKSIDWPRKTLTGTVSCWCHVKCPFHVIVYAHLVGVRQWSICLHLSTALSLSSRCHNHHQCDGLVFSVLKECFFFWLSLVLGVLMNGPVNLLIWLMLFCVELTKDEDGNWDLMEVFHTWSRTILLSGSGKK